MVVRTVYTLKRLSSFDEATEYAKRIQKGAGRHKESELEIQYDPKWRANAGTPAGSGVAIKGLKDMLAAGDEAQQQEEEPDGAWMVVVVNESIPPGGKLCAECDRAHFEDDFLCSECRALG